MMKLAPYPEYKESASPAAPKIPDQWTVHRCRYLFREVDERSKDGQETHLSMSQKHGLIDSSKIDKWRLQSESYAGGKLCKDGDLVLNRLKAHLGVFAHAKQYGVVSPDYTVLRPITDDSTRFFEFLFKSPPFITEFTKSTKGIVKGFWRLYTDDFYSIRAVVPPPEEQKQILRFIDSLTTRANKFIRNKRRLIELLKEQKQNVINQAVIRGLDPKVKLKPSGVEWIGDIPEHWEMRKTTHIFSQIGSGTTPQSGNADYYDGDIPWIISGDLTDGFLEITSKKVTSKAIQDYSTLKIYPEASLVVAMYGATIGKVSLTTIRACTNQACCVLSNARYDINKKFMLLMFLKIKPDLVRMGYGGGQPNISQDTIKSLRLPIPPIEEQGDIVALIENETAAIDQAITRALREIELMREYRTRLISDVVTGQVDVRSIEVPEVTEDELLALDEDTADADDVIDAEGDMDETD